MMVSKTHFGEYLKKKGSDEMLIILVVTFVLGMIFGTFSTYKILNPDKVWEEGFTEGRNYEKEHKS